MRHIIILGILTTIWLTASAPAHAQQLVKIPRVGYLTGTSVAAPTARIDAFRQGLREQGYVEGKSIVIAWRGADGKAERLAALATDLVRLKVDVIVTTGSSATRAAKEATLAIPIVMANDSDPIGNGFIASLARPGGNITGLSTLAPELSGKRLDLLKEIVPKLARVAVFGSSASLDNAQSLKEVELAAGAVGVKLQYLDVRDPKDIATAYRAASKERADAVLIMISGAIALTHQNEIADLAVKHRLPAIYERESFVEAGGLLSYGVNRLDLDRRAAVYVGKILKGAKTTDLPVEQPIKFEFVVNLKAAKAIGLAIPPNVLVRADRVIR